MYKLFLPLILLLAACGSESSDSNKKSIRSKTHKERLEKHSLFNNKAELKLNPNYERFNYQELAIVARAQDKNSFINQMFNVERLEAIAELKENVYFFIDTTNYRDIIQFSRLVKHSIVSKGAASYIGGLFKKSLSDLIPDAQIIGTLAKFGANANFSYGYFKFVSKTEDLSFYSNHYAVSSAKGSYIIFNLSDQDIDHSNIKNQLRFNE